MRFVLGAIALQVLAASAAVQVFLHPAPNTPHGKHAPTLTAAQAKAVLSHHLSEPIGDFEEIPQDEGLWSHLLHVWSGEDEVGSKPRIVIIDGGVSAQGTFHPIPIT